VEIEKEAAQFHFWEYINWIFFGVQDSMYLRMVQSSPPRQDSISMYRYFRSLKVLNSFTMNWESDSSIISYENAEEKIKQVARKGGGPILKIKLICMSLS
jgi:hypothetical protein